MMIHTLSVYDSASVVGTIMGKYLAVFTVLLFFTALFQCCLAGGGEIPSDDPVSAYVTVIIAK